MIKEPHTLPGRKASTKPPPPILCFCGHQGGGKKEDGRPYSMTKTLRPKNHIPVEKFLLGKYKTRGYNRVRKTTWTEDYHFKAPPFSKKWRTKGKKTKDVNGVVAKVDPQTDRAR